MNTNTIDVIIKHGDKDKTYPIYVNGRFRELTPIQLGCMQANDDIEITRGMYDSIIERLSILERYLK